MENNYSTVTELPGNKASAEQLQRFYTRYCFARQFCEGKEVLEVACGGGQGLGFLAERAKKVVGGDIDEKVLEFPRKYYKDRNKIRIQLLDAEKLPFVNDSFDIIIFFEAVYYLKNAKNFLAEAWRVLRPGGKLIIGTVNKNWSDFNPSPFSYKYYSVPELFNLLEQYRFGEIKFFGDTPINSKSIIGKLISLIKRAAVRLHLIPKTMKGKAFFKRLFFGKLLSLPSEIKEGMSIFSIPSVIDSHKANYKYKVLFSVATK